MVEQPLARAVTHTPAARPFTIAKARVAEDAQTAVGSSAATSPTSSPPITPHLPEDSTVPLPGATKQGFIGPSGSRAAAPTLPAPESSSKANAVGHIKGLKSSAELQEEVAAVMEKITELESGLEEDQPLGVLIGFHMVVAKTKAGELASSWSRAGKCSKMELRQHVRKFIDKPDTRQIDALFQSLDSTNSGSVSEVQLKDALKKCVSLAAKVDAGTARTRELSRLYCTLKEEILDAFAATLAAEESAAQAQTATSEDIDLEFGKLLRAKGKEKMSTLTQAWGAVGKGIGRNGFIKGAQKFGAEVALSEKQLGAIFEGLTPQGTPPTLSEEQLRNGLRTMMERAKKSMDQRAALEQAETALWKAAKASQTALKKRKLMLQDELKRCGEEPSSSATSPVTVVSPKLW